MRKIVYFLVMGGIATLGIELQADTAFTLQERSVLFCAKLLYYETDSFWNAHGKARENYDEFQMHEYDLHFGYGISNFDTLHLKTSYVRINEELNGRSLGWDDVEISWKHRFGCWCDNVVAGKLTLIIPGGERKQPVRYGVWGAEATVLLTKLWRAGTWGGWFDGSLGYRWYEGYPSDQIRAFGSIAACRGAWTLLNNNYLDYGIWNGKDQHGQALIRDAANYRLWKTELELRYQICNWLTLSGGYFHHLWGRNVGRGGGYYGHLSCCF